MKCWERVNRGKGQLVNMCVWQRHHDFTVCLLFERMNFLVSWGLGGRIPYLVLCLPPSAQGLFLLLLDQLFQLHKLTVSLLLHAHKCHHHAAHACRCLPHFAQRCFSLFSLGSCCASQLKCEMLLSKANKSLHSDNNELCIMFAEQNRFLFLTVK